jgi:hypothetical protein
MGKHMGNLDDEDVVGKLAVDDHSFAQLGITNNDRFAGHAKRVCHARDHENHSDIWVAQDVAKRFEPTIAQAVWNGDGSLIEHLDEAWWIAFWRNVDQSIRAGGRYKYKRRVSNEAASMLVNLTHGLGQGPLWWHTHYRSYLLFTHNHFAETVPQTDSLALHGPDFGAAVAWHLIVRMRRFRSDLAFYCENLGGRILEITAVEKKHSRPASSGCHVLGDVSEPDPVVTQHVPTQHPEHLLSGTLDDGNAGQQSRPQVDRQDRFRRRGQVLLSLGDDMVAEMTVPSIRNRQRS